MTKKKLQWVAGKSGQLLLNNKKGKVFISYITNETPLTIAGTSDLDSANPETAIVLINDKILFGKKVNRYLIYRGNRMKELEPLYPNIKKLKAHWKKYGGHFWSDDL
jgi:hypothetical protein